MFKEGFKLKNVREAIIGILVIIVIGIAFLSLIWYNSLLRTEQGLASADQTISNKNLQITNLNISLNASNQTIRNEEKEISILSSENANLSSKNAYLLQIINETTPKLEKYSTYIPSGSVYTILPGGYRIIGLGINTLSNSNISITGSFVAQGGYVQTMLMTPMQYGAFTENIKGVTMNLYQTNAYDEAYYGYSEGGNINSFFSKGLQNSELYIVFYNPSNTTTVVVRIVNRIYMNYTYTS